MTAFDANDRSAAHRAILSKRDTRSYLTVPVERVALDRILDAGRMAGTAKNQQSIRVVVVTDTATKTALTDCGDFADWIADAPIVLALTVSSAAGPRRLFDVGRAAQNILLAAHVEGLASCPVTMHRDPCCRDALGVPDDVEIPMVITIGHRPKAETDRRSHPRLALDEFTSWGQWGAPRPPAVICHLVTVGEWEAANDAGAHRPPSLETEGFIHFSTIEQLVATAGRYHAGATDLLVVCVPTAAVESDLKFEQPAMPDSPVADEFFPHLYRALSPDEAILVTPIESGPSGFVLPAEIQSLLDAER